MRKIKKDLLTVILTAFALIVAIPSVSAFAVGEGFTNFGNRTVTLDSSLKLGDYGNGNTIYSATYSGDGTKYDIFCMDPGKATPPKLYVHRLLLAQEGIEAKDFGLATIITTEQGDDSFSTSGDKFVFAKGIALRVFLDGNNRWSSSESNADAIKALRKISDDWNAGRDSSSITGPSDVIADAKKLYLKGLEAYKNYSTDKTLDIKTEIIEVPEIPETPEDVIEPDEEEDDNSFVFGAENNTSETTEGQAGPVIKDVSKKIIIKFSLNNFDTAEGVFKFDSFEGGSGENVTTRIVGMTTENTTDFSQFTTPISYGTNVFETFKDKAVDNQNGTSSLEFYVAVETTGTVEFNISTEGSEDEVCEDACKEANGKLKYTYIDPKALTGAVLYDTAYGNTTGSQRFLIASKSQNTNSEEVEIPVKACAKECAKPEKCVPVRCEGDKCEYDSTLPQICTDDAEVDEDGLVEYKFIEAYTEDGYNIVKCLLGTQKDAADNPYKLEDGDNAKAVMDNPYCKILCKEDYSIRVPYKQTTDEGRYFKISLSLKGQQDCYSTKFNTEQFNKDIIAKEKEVIDAINIWNIYYELVNKDENTLYNDPSNYESCDRLTCDPSAGSREGCRRDTEESTPDTQTSAWYVQKGTMIWGQNPDVKYFQIDVNTGQISPIAEPTEFPEGVLKDYGYIENQTYRDGTCKFRDDNTKKSITSSYSDGFGTVGGVKLRLKKNGSTLYWELDNSSGENRISSESYLVRGYNSSGELVFQKRLTVSARARTKDTGNIEIDSAATKITLVGYDEEDRYDNITCSAQQEPCPKVEAPDHFKEMKEQYKNDLEIAKAEVEEKVEELKQIIDQYNSCVGDKEYEALSEGYAENAFWRMIYKYDPEIKYSYDEPDPTDPGRDKWIDEVKGLNCEDGTCDIMYSKNETITAEDCPESGEGDNKVGATCTTVGADSTIPSVFADSADGTNIEKETYVNTYCIGNVKDDYSCDGETLHSLGDTAYEKKPFFICTFEDNKFRCEEEEHPLTKVNYIHKAAGAEGDYDTRLVYYSGHDNGDIKIRYSEQPILNYSLVQGLPVSADTPQGTYIYILNIENIGTFYNTGKLGRIYGSDPKSLSTYARGFQDTPTASYPITTGVGENATDIPKEIAINEYACTYTVSQSSCTDGEGNVHTIDECDFGGAHANWAECQKDICNSSGSAGSYCVKEAESYYICNGTSYDKDNCRKVGSRAEALASATYNYNCCPECQVVCVGKCLYVVSNDKENDGTLQYDFRTVSPQNMNPNSRKLGYNWDSANASNSLSAQKAANTIAEIEARAGAGSNPNINIAEISEYKLKVTMTPDMVTWIKEYNNEQASQGAYNNDSLTCYSYELDGYNEDQCKSSGYIWENETCKMSNVFCYSSFIDELEGKFPEQVDAPHRSEAKNNAYDNFRAYTGLANQGQTIITNDYWTIYKYDNLDINGDGLPDIGPSWK